MFTPDSLGRPLPGLPSAFQLPAMTGFVKAGTCCTIVTKYREQLDIRCCSDSLWSRIYIFQSKIIPVGIQQDAASIALCYLFFHRGHRREQISEVLGDCG
jgi:hypothetical protein